MIRCPNCGALVPDGNQFCTECGSKIVIQPKMIKCPNCGSETDPDNEFCSNCGRPLRIQQAPPVNQPNQKQPKQKNRRKRKSFKIPALIIGLVAVIAIGVVVAFKVFNLFGGDDEPANQYVAYVQDDEIYLMDLKHKALDPVQLTDHLANNSADWEDYRYAGNYVTFIDHYVVYPDRVDDFDNNKLTLYYKDLNNLKKDAVKIDSDVNGIYSVENDSIMVYYTYEDNGYDLYMWNFKDQSKNKIVSDMDYYPNNSSFVISDDAKTMYAVGDETLYCITNGKEFKSEKIDKGSENLYINYVSDDFKTIYYSTEEEDTYEDTLYKYTDGNKEKVAEGIYDIQSYDDGTFMYCIANEIADPLENYVNDPDKSSDESIEYPHYFDYDDSDDYYDARDEYYDAQDRNNIREGMDDYPIYKYEMELYYYNGKEAKQIDLPEGYYKLYNYDFSSDAKEVVLVRMDTSTNEQIDFNDYTSAYDIYSAVQENLNHTVVIADTEKATESTIDEVNLYNTYVYLSNDGKKGYFKNYDSSEWYECDIKDRKISNFNYLFKGSDDSYESTFLLSDNIYKEDGDLYQDGNLISYDVESCGKRDDSFIIYQDYDYDSNDNFISETISVYKDGKLTKVSDDVFRYGYIDSNNMVLMTNLSTSNSTADLVLYKAGKCTTLKTDITMLLRVQDN